MKWQACVRRFVLAQRDAGVALGVPDLASPPRPGVVGGVHGEVDPVQLAADALPIPAVRDLAVARGAGAQQILLPPCHGRVHQRRSRRRAALQRPAQVAKERARVADLDRSAQIEQPPGGVEHLAGDRLGKVAKVEQRADLLAPREPALPLGRVADHEVQPAKLQGNGHPEPFAVRPDVALRAVDEVGRDGVATQQYGAPSLPSDAANRRPRAARRRR